MLAHQHKAGLAIKSFIIIRWHAMARANINIKIGTFYVPIFIVFIFVFVLKNAFLHYNINGKRW